MPGRVSTVDEIMVDLMRGSGEVSGSISKDAPRGFAPWEDDQFRKAVDDLVHQGRIPCNEGTPVEDLVDRYECSMDLTV